MTQYYSEHSKVWVSVDCIIFGFEGNKLKLLIGKRQMDPGRGEWSLYGGFVNSNENLEDVGATMGISRWKVIKDVILPLSRGTILEMMSYFFVNCMMTISAVSFLANVNNKPIALMITQFEGQMQLECAAFVSLLILVVNVAMKYVVFIIKKRIAI